VEAPWTHHRLAKRQIVGDHVTVSRSTQFLIRPQNVCDHMMTDTDEIKGTATFQAVLDADRDDIQVFRREHGDDKLAEALEVTIDF